MHHDSNAQRLPNECLYLIVDYLRTDLVALRTLLLVNRFFFHAAVPWMLNDPLTTWEMTYATPEVETNVDKFMALLIASVLHAQRAKAQSVDEDFTANGFLSKFGFQLVEPVTSPLLQDAAQGVSPTTIDYSRYFTDMLYFEWSHVGFPTLVRLKEFPPAWKDEMPIHNDWGMRIEYSEGAGPHTEHTEELQTHREYKEEVQERMVDFFLYHNTKYITTLDFNIADSHRYLQYADKLESLKILFLDRFQSMPDSHQMDAISFIVQNRTAFPRKRPLRLEFGYSWSSSDEWDDLTPLEKRKRQIVFQKTRIALYEAVGNLQEIDVSDCPGFYDNCGNIDVEYLEELEDRDQHRMMYEGPQQRAFLERCHQLRTLKLGVSQPDMFSWLVEKKDGTTRSLAANVLQNLKVLDLSSDSGASCVLPALEDAVIAFGKSLTDVVVRGYVSTELEVVHELPSRPPSISMWNLPFVRSIDISIQSYDLGHIGRFDLPQLEELKFSVSMRTMQPVENDITASPTIVLAEQWELKKLKKLHLYDIAALAFNYDSLDHMRNLQELRMIVGKQCQISYPAESIPRLRRHVRYQETPNNKNNNEDGNNNGSEPEPADQKWKDCWNLPKLRTLILEGPPDAVFSFSWLCGCPSLESVKLMHKAGFQRLAISSASEYSSYIPRISKELPVEDVEDTSMDPNMQPLWGSKLQSFTFKGPWIMSKTDLITALTVYAPNLSTLSLDRIHVKATLNGKGFLKMLLEAKAVGRALAEDAVEQDSSGTSSSGDSSFTSIVPVGKLNKIQCQYGLGKRSAAYLCLLEIPRKEAQSYRDSGMTVFSVMGKDLIVNPERRAREGWPV
ncbi:hypothetical protein BG006_006345 [Podila minutissima]|uniref:Uncharacterized protein n=1 Tax=Podila minutissima TaxID=64525 RepID=A0A9P5SL90_9FUNG|nr:hypothetical protein BG006_006345 [Podila minutissima]